MSEKQSLGKRLARWTRRVAKGLFLLLIGYGLIVLIGLIPVNNGFVPAESGVTIYVRSNSVHADLIVPKTNELADWVGEFSEFKFQGDLSHTTHVAIGWGDEGFFLKTPTWSDLKFSIAAKALLWPSDSCMHVEFINPNNDSGIASVTISDAQYRELCGYIRNRFKTDASGSYIQISGYHYGTTDAFFEAYGHYHIFNTCNSWVGGGLKATGVKAPWISSLPKTPMLYLD